MKKSFIYLAMGVIILTRCAAKEPRTEEAATAESTEFVYGILDPTRCTEEELQAMTPQELFDAFCLTNADAEYTDMNTGKKRPLNAVRFDFSDDENNPETVCIKDPVDLDNDGEVEFILHNAVYGDWYFDCKDGKIICFAYGEGTADYCSHVTYKDATWIVHSDTAHSGRVVYTLDKYNGDLYIEETIKLGQIESEDKPGEMKYYYNDGEITKEEYDAYYKEIFGE